MTKSILVALSVFCAAGIFVPSLEADLIGPTPYLKFADSPFSGGTFSYFHLESFEDGLLNTPGVSASSGAVSAPSAITDSVDEDDGAIDGSGTGGNSYFFSNPSAAGVTFTFNALALGSLPTHAGIVWTDGLGLTTFEGFDENGVSLGVLTADSADGVFLGQTAEDRFYGVRHAGGISKIFISNVFAGSEVDHLQYGLGPIVPEPGSWLLFGMGAAAVASYFLRIGRRSH